ncbi:polygalacturonase [Levilactobacillus zymae]|uniref:Polygalacturonase n=1 Tax=Levilactobacillus zymae TaxID=267363 RepID=A0ABQ0WUQ6_9LACO|nr:glycosyl hydrolase family 28 protein [Levilactobacillus zymae]KRL07614.1 hypothetical protein FD38_GL000131 [Levilactobacillus zymae DSM 19395]QFR62080.1 polygalacturonase [Levilactobacillus zymae]GEO71554.1 polygalacturonase [Levilactobacillus zymae]
MQLNVLEHLTYAEVHANATAAIQTAIDACAQVGGGTVLVPGSGPYVIDGLVLKSHVTLHIAAGATLVGSGNEARYTHRPGPFELNRHNTPICGLIYAKGQTDIAITGAGAIDGNFQRFIYPDQGDEVHLKFYKYPRPMTVYFEDCHQVRLQDVTLQNAPFWTVHLVGCHNTEIARVTIHNEPRMPNTDGIDVDRSHNTYIHDCAIVTGDDAICPKCTEETAAYGDCTNLLVENCTIRTQSSAVKFGSSSFGNFYNCHFQHLTITNTNRGLTFQLRDPGSAENIRFNDISIATKHYSQEWWGAGEPIFISLLPRDAQTDLTGQVIRNVSFTNITCDAENGLFIGSVADHMIQNLTFDHVTLTLRRPLDSPVQYDLRPWQGTPKIFAPLRGIETYGENSYTTHAFVVHPAT